MASGYSTLFSQGLMRAEHVLAPSPVVLEPPQSPRNATGRTRRRRSSISVEGSTSPISLLRSPSRAAAQALSRILRSPSARAGHARDGQARLAAVAPTASQSQRPARLERPRLVFLPPRPTPAAMKQMPAPTRPVPLPPAPAPASPALSTLSAHSFLSLERTPSPPPSRNALHQPRDPLAPFNHAPSYAATVLPHVSMPNGGVSAAELHNALVAPYAAGIPSPPRRRLRDVHKGPVQPRHTMFDYSDSVHPYRAMSLADSFHPTSFLTIGDDDEGDEYEEDDTIAMIQD